MGKTNNNCIQHGHLRGPLPANNSTGPLLTLSESSYGLQSRTRLAFLRGECGSDYAWDAGTPSNEGRHNGLGILLYPEIYGMTLAVAMIKHAVLRMFSKAFTPLQIAMDFSSVDYISAMPSSLEDCSALAHSPPAANIATHPETSS